LSAQETVLDVKNVAKEFTLVELERLAPLAGGFALTSILELSSPIRLFQEAVSEAKNTVRKIVAVRDVSFSVGRGQVFGFLGPNGAGKTTTVKMCMDLIRPSSGTIEIFGKPPGDPATKARIGYSPEHPYFYDYLTPLEILRFYAKVFGLSPDVSNPRIGELLERVGLADAQTRQLRKFSKGMLQRLGIAQALINDPELLVLDEPLSGLDPMGRKEIRDIVIEERKKGKSIVFISHILSDIEYLCDRVAIVANGTVVKQGSVDDLLMGGVRRTEIFAHNLSDELKQSLISVGSDPVELGSTSRIVVATSAVQEHIRKIMDGGGVVDQVQPHRDSLEDLFLREAGG